MTAPSAWRRISWIRKRTRPSQSSLRDASSPERGSFFALSGQHDESPLAGANPLRRSRARFPFLSPMVTSSPGAGEVFPLRESQDLKPVTKVLGETRKLPAVLLALPLGELSPQVTERAHAVSPVVKASDAIRNSPATSKSFPLGRAGAGAPERVLLKVIR